MLTESILSSLITIVDDLEVNSSLPDNALHGSLPITLANAPDNAPSSKSASLIFNSAAQRDIKLSKSFNIRKMVGEWLVAITEQNKDLQILQFPKGQNTSQKSIIMRMP